jgi:hypothetical protein
MLCDDVASPMGKKKGNRKINNKKLILLMVN